MVCAQYVATPVELRAKKKKKIFIRTLSGRGDASTTHAHKNKNTFINTRYNNETCFFFSFIKHKCHGERWGRPVERLRRAELFVCMTGLERRT